MSQENVEVVRRAYDALGREDWVALRELIANECEVHDFDIPDAANVYRGPDGVLNWLEHWSQAWETWSIRDLTLRQVGDDGVLALFRMVTKGRDSGIEMNRDDAVVYKVHDGKLWQVDYYNDQEQALGAAGLRGSG